MYLWVGGKGIGQNTCSIHMGHTSVDEGSLLTYWKAMANLRELCLLVCFLLIAVGRFILSFNSKTYFCIHFYGMFLLICLGDSLWEIHSLMWLERQCTLEAEKSLVFRLCIFLCLDVFPIMSFDSNWFTHTLSLSPRMLQGHLEEVELLAGG